MRHGAAGQMGQREAFGSSADGDEPVAGASRHSASAPQSPQSIDSIPGIHAFPAISATPAVPGLWRSTAAEVDYQSEVLIAASRGRLPHTASRHFTPHQSRPDCVACRSYTVVSTAPRVWPPWGWCIGTRASASSPMYFSVHGTLSDWPDGPGLNDCRGWCQEYSKIPAKKTNQRRGISAAECAGACPSALVLY
jgi:hypothetical protein